MFSYVDLEDRVPAKHPLRVIRRIVNDVPGALDGELRFSFWRCAISATAMKASGAISAISNRAFNTAVLSNLPWPANIGPEEKRQSDQSKTL